MQDLRSIRGIMKILQVSNSSMGNGGVQKVIMDIVQNLPEHKFDVLVFNNKESYHEKNFISFGGQVFRIPYYDGKRLLKQRLDFYFRFFKLFFGTYRLLRKNGKYDAIHCHNYFDSGICNAAAFFAGVKIRISHSHSSRSEAYVSFWRKIIFTSYKILMKIFSNVRIGCSQGAVDFLFQDDKKAIIVTNGIDLKKFDVGKYEYKVSDNIKFIHVGRYCKVKNQSFLLDVFSLVSQKFDNVSLNMVGHGPDKTRIQEKIRKLGLDTKVRMLSHDTDIPKIMSDSHYMIFPSLFEGLGIALFEAQSMGVLCFASGGLAHESNLGLVTYLDLNSGARHWADNIIEIIENDDLSVRKSITDEKLNSVNIKAIGNKYREIYAMGKINR